MMLCHTLTTPARLSVRASRRHRTDGQPTGSRGPAAAGRGPPQFRGLVVTRELNDGNSCHVPELPRAV